MCTVLHHGSGDGILPSRVIRVFQGQGRQGQAQERTLVANILHKLDEHFDNFSLAARGVDELSPVLRRLKRQLRPILQHPLELELHVVRELGGGRLLTLLVHLQL